MVARPLTRWGGLAAALAGVLGIGLALVFPIAYALLGLETSQQVVAWTATVQTPVTMALCLSWLLQMAGLVGVQTRQAASSGRTGWASLALALGLLALGLGSTLLDLMLPTRFSTLVAPGVLLSWLLLPLAVLLYGLVTWWAGRLGRWSSLVFWMGLVSVTAVVLNMVFEASPGLSTPTLVAAVLSILHQLGWVGLGYALWSAGGPSQPASVDSSSGESHGLRLA